MNAHPNGPPNTSFHFSPPPSDQSTRPSMSFAKRSSVAGGRQITRNRASYSCHTCRRRKVKCDKVHPVCGNCVKNGTECVYDAAPQKESTAPRSQQGSGSGNANGNGHGVKRRRESRPLEDDETVGLQSVYGDIKHEQPQSPGHRPGSQAIEARLDKLTSMIERLSKTNQPLDQADKQLLLESAQRDSRPVIHNSKPDTAKPQADSRTASPRRMPELTGDEFPVPSGQATDLVDPVGSLNLGHLSLEDGGRSRYVGTTYWAYISHEINELNQLLRDQNRSHNASSPNEHSVDGDEAMADPIPRTPGKPWKIVDDVSVRGNPLSHGDTFQRSVLFPSGDSPSLGERTVEPEMLEHLPTKRQSHILYKGFMSGVHAISPVLHPPTILKSYNAFWDWYDYSSYSGDPCPEPSFIPLLYAIWYGGSVTISMRTITTEFNVSSRFALSKMYHDEVTRWLTKISFPRSPSLQGLAAYLIVQTILSREEEPLTSSLFISLAMRVAQTMGLHRDPAKFGLGPCEAEYRRRLWWHIVHMDGVVAMSSGLPPLVSDENYWDVRDPSEVKDTLIGLPEGEQYEQLVASNMRVRDSPDDPTVCGGPSMVNVHYLSARGKYVMARAVRRILKIQLGTKPLTRRDMEEFKSILLDLQLKLGSIINRIPDVGSHNTPASHRSMSFSSRSPVETRSSDTELPGEGPNGCPEQYHSPVLVAFHKWARILLSLFIDKAYCVAYQPFLKNAKSRIWPAARQSALRHCHGFMEKFISLASDSDFQPFQWSWPGNHQPMHATMIMLIDLYERPYSPEAAKSRAFIDKIFSLTGPDGGVVGGEDGVSTQRPLKDGGREAWDMISRLRQKAWQKAGLDPQKLWTEKAQMQTGFAPQDEAITDPYYAAHPRREDSQLDDFSKTFHSITRSHVVPSLASSQRPSPLRYQLPPSIPSSAPGTPQLLPTPNLTQSPTASRPEPVIPASGISPDTLSQLNNPNPTIPNPQQPIPVPSIPPIDPSSPYAQAQAQAQTQSLGVSTPPSMVDPSLNFDWDQWDAVFGQHLPVADELMELDPVSGFEFADLGNARLGSGAGSGSGSGNGTGTADGRWFG